MGLCTRAGLWPTGTLLLPAGDRNHCAGLIGKELDLRLDERDEDEYTGVSGTGCGEVRGPMSRTLCTSLQPRTAQTLAP